MQIVDLDLDDPRTDLMLQVLTELRTHLTADTFRQIYREGWPQGLRFSAVFDSTDGTTRCLGVAGWRVMALTFYGRKLYVDDLVTTSSARSAGVGHALIDYLTERARAAGCAAIDLDSGVQRHDAHRFYLRERFDIAAHHFEKRVGTEVTCKGHGAPKGARTELGQLSLLSPEVNPATAAS